MRFYIIPNYTRAATQALLKQATEHLRERKVDFFCLPEDAAAIRYGMREYAEMQKSDFVLTIGGDGTIIGAAAAAAMTDRPIIGVQAGRVGFLAALTPDEMIRGLDCLCEGRYTLMPRTMLKAVIDAAGHAHFLGNRVDNVLNEIVFSAPNLLGASQFRVALGETRVATLVGSGLIIATPTGSTAFSRSAGGSNIDARVPAFIITPVCPYEHTMSPTVVPDDLTITVTPLVDGARFVADGKQVVEIEKDRPVTVVKSKNALRFIVPQGLSTREKMI